MTQPQSAVLVCCLGPAGDTAPDVPRFAFDGDPADRVPPAGVVLPWEPEARARELLQAGACVVFLGEMALMDGTLVGRLAAQFGAARIGVYAPAKRMQVSWALETVSNADFKFMMPSRCEPCWEILDAAGARTGTELGWWVGEMSKLGASAILVRADVRDDGDLNLVAALTERHGERLWIGPLEDEAPRLEDWIAYAGVRRLALPRALLAHIPGAVARGAGSAAATPLP